MKERARILIAGGDRRQLSCAAKLSEEFTAAAVGFDSELLPVGLVSPDEGCFGCLVLPITPLDDNSDIPCPLAEKNLNLQEILPLLTPDALIVSGKEDERLKTFFPNRHIISYLSREELCLRNAVPTAEGAVAAAISNLPVTLSGAKVLVVGMGRIGTALVELLKGFGSDITVAVRNSKGAANAKLHGVRAIRSDNIGNGWTVVFNTVPMVVFCRELLRHSDKSTLYIDLASGSGGIDFEAAADYGIKAVHALGLPARTAPVTAGEIVAETVSEILAEEGRYHV